MQNRKSIAFTYCIQCRPLQY